MEITHTLEVWSYANGDRIGRSVRPGREIEPIFTRVYTFGSREELRNFNVDLVRVRGGAWRKSTRVWENGSILKGVHGQELGVWD